MEVQDIVTVKLFIDSDVTVTEVTESYVMDFITSYAAKKGVTWHAENPRVGTTKSSIEDISTIIEVQLYIGESVNDEWIITDSVLNLSRKFPNLSISVTDSDGQFILMEAAETLPDWVLPENCDNRVFIRDGSFRLIPPTDPTIDPQLIQSLPLNEALRYLQEDDAVGRSILPPASHTAIHARIAQCYSDPTSPSHLHFCWALIPLSVARALRAMEDKTTTSTYKNKTKNTLTGPVGWWAAHFPPTEHLQNADRTATPPAVLTQAVAAARPNPETNPLVLVGANLSRLQFARLLSLNQTVTKNSGGIYTHKDFDPLEWLKVCPTPLNEPDTPPSRPEILMAAQIGVKISEGMLGYISRARDSAAANLILQGAATQKDTNRSNGQPSPSEILMSAVRAGEGEFAWLHAELAKPATIDWMEVDASHVDAQVLQRATGGIFDAGNASNSAMSQLGGLMGALGSALDKQTDVGGVGGAFEFHLEDDDFQVGGDSDDDEDDMDDGDGTRNEFADLAAAVGGLLKGAAAQSQAEEIGPESEENLMRALDEAFNSAGMVDGGPVASLMRNLLAKPSSSNREPEIQSKSVQPETPAAPQTKPKAEKESIGGFKRGFLSGTKAKPTPTPVAAQEEFEEEEVCPDVD